MLVSGEDWVDTGSESEAGATDEAGRKNDNQSGMNLSSAVGVL